MLAHRDGQEISVLGLQSGQVSLKESFGKESERIKFREVPAVKVLSIFHKGSYDEIGEAYAFITKYAEENGYKVNVLSRECYIDGIWNKDSVDECLTEIQCLQ